MIVNAETKLQHKLAYSRRLIDVNSEVALV